MEKFVPYEKLSKKERQKRNKAKRGIWGDINPVTRKPVNSKAYNRKRAQAWKKILPTCALLFLRNKQALLVMIPIQTLVLVKKNPSFIKYFA